MPIDSPETLPSWHFPWPAFDADWSRSALLVIDMQNYCCNPEAGLGPMLRERYPETASYCSRRLAETTIPATSRLLAGFRAAGRPVVYTRHGPCCLTAAT